MVLSLALGAAGLIPAVLHAAARTLVSDDYYRFLDVTDPQVAADGNDSGAETQADEGWTRP